MSVKPDFKKLVMDCQQLGQRMQRNTAMMRGEKMQDTLKEDDGKARSGHRYNLYGLNYQQVINDAQGGNRGKESISQLHARLTREKMSQQSRQQYENGVPVLATKTTREGREYLINKRFDVGDFEHDMRNIDKNYKELERKILQDRKKGAENTEMTPDVVDSRGFQGVQNNSNYNQKLIEQGINSNLNHQQELVDSNFYSKIQKRFKLSMTQLKKNQKDQKVDDSNYQIVGMQPLSRIKIKAPKQEKFIDSSSQSYHYPQHDSSSQGKAGAQQDSSTEEQEFQKILQGQSVVSRITKAYLKKIQSRLDKNLFSKWQISKLNLNSVENEFSMSIYQKAMNQLIKDDHLASGLDDKHKNKSLQTFAQSVLKQWDSIQKEKQNLEQHEELQQSYEFMDIWNGILEIAKQKDGDNWPWPKNDDTLSLYVDNDERKTNCKLARILSVSLEHKFRNSILESEKDAKSDNEINNYISLVEHWITDNLKNTVVGNQLSWDNNRDTATYAVIFILFMCGQHEAALKYCESFGRQDGDGLYELYKSYYKTNGCKGILRSQIKPHFNEATKGNNPDEYKAILAHLMTGKTYKEDANFLSGILFNDNDIATWYFLKLASFEILHNLPDGQQDLEIVQDLPLGYRPFTLEDLQSKILVVDDDQISSDSHMLEVIKTLFYTGKFTLMVQKLMAYSNGKFFIDSVNLMIILNDLGILKTKFKLTKLLYQKREELKGVPLIEREYTMGCLDIQAILTYYLDLMKYQGPSKVGNLTDAVCIMLKMEDGIVSEAAFVQYLLNNKDPMLEVIKETKKEYIEFSSSAQQSKKQQTIREFFGDKDYIKLVEKMVEFNTVGSNHIQENLLMMDKIQQYDKVVEYMEEMQMKLIEKDKPTQFLSPILDLEVLKTTLNGKLQNNQIDLVRNKFKTIYDNYQSMKSGKLSCKSLLYLTVIAEGFNQIIIGQIDVAMEQFERITLIPIRPSDKPDKKFFQDFEEFENYQNLLLDVVIASAKCLYIISKLILQSTDQAMLNYTKTAEAEKKRNKLAKSKAQLQNLNIYLETLLKNKCYKSDENLQNKINQSAQMIRYIIMDLS